MSQLKSDNFGLSERYFHEARRLPEGERGAYLAEVCGGSDDLRHEVEALLAMAGSLPSVEDVGSSPLEGAVDAGIGLLLCEESMVGREVGDYRIVELIGRGGIGEVYLAEDQSLNRRVAIKFLRSAFTCNEARVEQLRREAQAASSLNHPNIVTIHQIGNFEGRAYIVMERIDGQTLRQRMEAGRLSFAESIAIAEQVVAAIRVAHRNGIVHCDLKPENLMITPDGLVKVLDFGLAKLVSESALGVMVPGIPDLRASGLMGTPEYMSPEQVTRQRLDGRTDIFSLGVILYEMVAGHRPFSGESSDEVMRNIARFDPPPLTALADGCPEALQRVIGRCLAKRTEDRYQTAGALLDDLRMVEQSVNGGRGRLVMAMRALVMLLIFAMPAGIGLALDSVLSDYSFRDNTVRVLPTPRRSGMGVLTADGKRMVYVAYEQDNFTLWVQDLESSLTKRLLGPSLNGYLWPAISPDDRYIYLVRVRDLTPPKILDSHRRPLTRNNISANRYPTVSPDGRYVVSSSSLGGTVNLYRINIDGTNQCQLTSGNLDQEPLDGRPATRITHFRDDLIREFEWSPDGQRLLCVRSNDRRDMVIINRK